MLAAAIEIMAAESPGLSLKYSMKLELESSSLAARRSASVKPHPGSLQVISIESTVSDMSCYIADISL